MKRKFGDIVESHNKMLEALKDIEHEIMSACDAAVKCIKSGGKILFCGNGGSAADAQHLAAEFIGRFMIDRAPIPAFALTTDSSILTCVSNDYSFDDVFSRQVSALCNKNDLLVGISTSGNSKNVVEAVKSAKKNGAITIGMLGKDGGALMDLVDFPICIAHPETARIQEGHIMIGHFMCEIIESSVVDR